jgi:NAD+ kinase
MSQAQTPKKQIKKVGIITKRNIISNKALLKKLVEYLKKKKKQVIFDTNATQVYKDEQGHKKSEILRKADLVLVLGGDGTLLKTARRLSRHKVLILPVNLGNLGFLTEAMPEKIFETLDKVFKNQYYTDRRSLLRVTVYRNSKKFHTSLALNDTVINQGAFARLIKMHLAIDDRKLVRFRGDGLIISTPTGSTAHSLSAGGPIVHPMVEGLLITPMNPISLSMRPIMVPLDKTVSVTIDTQRREDTPLIGLTIDGQEMLVLHYGDKVHFRHSKRYLYIVRTRNRYYQMLRSKLHWGEA